jgi:hypothetical protein
MNDKPDTQCAACGSLNGGHTMACQAIHEGREKPAQTQVYNPVSEQEAREAMPKLPAPFGSLERTGLWNGRRREGVDDVYDDEQMHAYARAYAAKLQSKLDQQAAEVERLRAERDAEKLRADELFSTRIGELEELCNLHHEAEARADANARDAERYRKVRECFIVTGTEFYAGPNSDSAKFYPRLYFIPGSIENGWRVLVSPAAVDPCDSEITRRGKDAERFVDAWVDAALNQEERTND